jgi:hypothetical protein
MVVSRLEGAARDDVHFDAQEFLKILGQADVIDKRGARLEIHEQVQVAVGASLFPGDRAEHRDPMSPTIPRDGEDLCAELAQALQGQRVIGHASKVTAHARTPPDEAWPAETGTSAMVVLCRGSAPSTVW